jgi:hypothetical protein
MPAKKVDSQAIAYAVALETAQDNSEVGEFLGKSEVEDDVYDFRFDANVVGYEHWQWSVTLYHDVKSHRWTVNESSLVPGEGALLTPDWVPWKDRLEPSDISVTDSLGTDPDDQRLEAGVVESSAGAKTAKFRKTRSKARDAASDEADESDESDEDLHDAVEEFELSRAHVLSPIGRQATAQRWYEGPPGPKSLSTRVADGKTCEICGFFIPLQSELNRLFGVCANKWSPDDGKVVSKDHGCGEHSEIEPESAPSLWPDREPLLDDRSIDIVAQSPRDEVAIVEAIEEADQEDVVTDSPDAISPDADSAEVDSSDD